MKVPVDFDPRDYQAEALTALDGGCQICIWCWARRGGKDFTAFCYAVGKMVEEPINVVLIWPTKKQGYDNFWIAIDNDGRPIMDQIPKSLVAGEANSPSDMHKTLKNGSTLTLMGATDPDALRGANAKIYILSEFVDLPASVLDVIRPIVAVNGGKIIIQSTPKIDGISGGTFKTLFDRALNKWTNGDKTQYASLITADRYLSPEILEDLRQECIAKNGNDFFWRQEYLCDWGQASSTSYYGVILEAMKGAGRVRQAPYNSAYPVYTAWDLGMSDSTAVIFFQYYNKKVYLIDYYETHDIGLRNTVEFVLAKPYNMAWHFFPHDGSVRDSDAIQRIEKAREYGMPNSSLLRREPVEDGIERVVKHLFDTVMNEGTTEDLRRKLMMYKRKFNALTGDYLGPEHKTESHAADSLRYMYKAIEDEFDAETGEFLYSPANTPATYESDLVATPAAYDPYR